MTSTIILLLLLAAAPGAALAQEPAPVRDTEGLFLDMSKLNLGTITSDEDKKRYIYTIQLEKARITRKTLKGVYENAFDLYRKGEFEAAKELAGRILAIDPAYEDAAILRRASEELRGAKKPKFSEKKLVESKFEEGMALYRQGRLVESTARWEEAVKLSPANLKAHYWLRKARKEMATEHFQRGERAYRQHRLREALDQWYSALILNPRYPRLSKLIARAESEARDADANEKLQKALNLYSQGQTVESLKILETVLETGPGNAKAMKLMSEIRGEIAAQHVSQGRQHYQRRKYEQAISEWKTAVKFGYDSRSAKQLVARANEQMRREADAKVRAADLAKQREEEARRAEEEAKAKAEEEAAQAKADEEAGKNKASGMGSTGGKDDKGAGGPVGGGAGTVSEDARRSSQQHYLSGVIYFQKGDYVKARDEWTLALQLDPGNSDAKAGLERIEKLYGGQ